MQNKWTIYSECKFKHLSDIPGSDGELAINRYWSKIREVVLLKLNIALFFGATGCGKSKLLPTQYFKYLQEISSFRGKLLVLTTAAKDVQDMLDVVLNCGICRHILEQDDLRQTFDYQAPLTNQEQQQGRVGRTKPGAHVQFKARKNFLSYGQMTNGRFREGYFSSSRFFRYWVRSYDLRRSFA